MLFIKKVIAKLHYNQLDEFVGFLESNFLNEDPSKSLLIFQLNPIKAAMQLLDILSKISKKYPLIECRSKLLRKVILEQTRSILQNLFLPIHITYFVKQLDLFNMRVIDYMEQHDSFSLLETKVMDRVIHQMWEGSYDTGGSFLSMSTCYKIIKKGSPSYHKDYERAHRLVC